MNEFDDPPRAIPVARPLSAVPVVMPVADDEPPVRRRRRRETPEKSFRPFAAIGSACEWLFGLACVMVGLAILAAIPIVQFLSLGYLLECSGRIARTGSFRSGFIGIRLAARLGGIVFASWLLLIPVRLAADYAHSASIIDPGGPMAQRWRIGLGFLIGLTAFHILTAIANGGKFRHFLSPFNIIFVLKKLAAGGFYRKSRDAVWDTLISLRLPYYFKLGFKGFITAMAWLVVPVSLIAISRATFTGSILIGFIGAFLLGLVVMYLPFLQARLGETGRLGAAFELRAVRRDYQKAPWLFAFAFVTTLLFALPLYLLKIEVVPAEAAWLPSLVFIVFMVPSRLLVGWALARANRREDARHWFFRWTGRVPFLPVAAVYVLFVFFAQYTSWNGIGSLYEQHAFSLPVPFFGL
jgi:hypothetical protein